MRKALCALALALAAAGVTAAGAFAAGEPAALVGSDITFDKPGLVLTVPDGPTVRSLRSARASAAAAAVPTPALGTKKFWYSRNGNALVRDRLFTLKAVTAHAELWVSDVLDFKPGDCRNDGVRNVLTQEQVDYLAEQFESNIYPTEAQEFSVPPARDGSHAIRGEPGTPFAGTGGDNYYGGDGERIVILVDNVRDPNYNDLNNSQGLTYIAGFFSPTLNLVTDRNVMTIDSYDWVHRTKANPPHEPVDGNNCTSKPARPFLYEGVFAHEYQHLLESYESPAEELWVNEGLSDFAIELTGYVDAARPVSQIGFDSHIQCFLGWLAVGTPANPNPRPTSGPENSLTLWNDQGDAETLCDYGAAFTFMEWLSDHYGSAFMSALHRQDEDGLAGLQATLDQFVTGKSSADVIHAWAASVALDKELDSGATLRGSLPQASYEVGALNADIRWESPETYSTPGAPPNGSDYVQLRNAAGSPLSAAQLDSLRFKGSTAFAPIPTQWTIDANPPLHAGDAAYFGGRADNLDNAMAREISVPSGAPSLTFDALWSTEVAFDSLFVQISTDGGKTWHSLGNADTTSTLSTGASALLRSNLPGFNGESGGWKAETMDLSQYAGQTVLLSFRYITDANTRGVTFDGVWVDNIKVNGVAVGDGTLAGWRSLTELNPVPVNGFTVQLVGIDLDRATPAVTATVPLDSSFAASLDSGKLRRLIGAQADLVGAIVTYDEPTQTITSYARYQLWANGALQPGG